MFGQVLAQDLLHTASLSTKTLQASYGATHVGILGIQSSGAETPFWHGNLGTYQVLSASDAGNHPHRVAHNSASAPRSMQQFTLSKAGATAVNSKKLLRHQRPVHFIWAQQDTLKGSCSCSEYFDGPRNPELLVRNQYIKELQLASYCPSTD